MDSDTWKIIIPIATFVLGSVLTLVVKSIEYRRTTRKDRRTTRKAAVSTLHRLANEWYNQLHELFGFGPSNQNGVLSEAFIRYLNNRIVLPEFLMNIEIVRGNRKCDKFVEQIEQFLEVVTNFEKNNGTNVKPETMYSCRNLLSSEQEKSPTDVLSELDPIVQRISKEAGVLLR